MAKKKDEKKVEIEPAFDFSNPDEENEYVAVNGVAMLIPKGEKSEVKPEYAEAWAISNALKKAKQRKLQQAKKEAESKQGNPYINTSY